MRQQSGPAPEPSPAAAAPSGGMQERTPGLSSCLCDWSQCFGSEKLQVCSWGSQWEAEGNFPQNAAEVPCSHPDPSTSSPVMQALRKHPGSQGLSQDKGQQQSASHGELGTGSLAATQNPPSESPPRHPTSRKEASCAQRRTRLPLLPPQTPPPHSSPDWVWGASPWITANILSAPHHT